MLLVLLFLGTAGGFLFILIQMVFLIDFICTINEYWLEKAMDGSKRYTCCECQPMMLTRPAIRLFGSTRRILPLVLRVSHRHNRCSVHCVRACSVSIEGDETPLRENQVSFLDQELYAQSSVHLRQHRSLSDH